MARANVVTDVSLDQFALIMGVHPTIFNGVLGSNVIPYDTANRPLIFQYDWQQHNQLGWETMARGIEQAENALARHLGWYLRPRFTVNEVQWNLDAADVTGGERKAIALGWGKFIAGGRETYIPINAEAAIIWLDQDADGIKETWQIVVDSELTDTSDIGVYYAEVDRVDDPVLSERWRIRPVYIQANTPTQGKLTITGKRWLITRPIITEQLNPRLDEGGISIYDDTKFASVLTVARRTANNAESYVSLLWQDGRQETGFVEQVGENYVIPYPGAYGQQWQASSVTDTTIRKLTISYLSGLPTDRHGNVQSELATIISHFAIGFMSRDMGSTQPWERQWQFYAEDLTSSNRALPYHPDEFNNPFGTWRGAMEAWRFVRGTEFSKYGK